jgi:outer membrane protein assembly factor BamB
MKTIALAIVFSFAIPLHSQPVFRFAHISDTHVGTGTGAEDLGCTVRDINSMPEIKFAIFSGDITEMGSNEELKLSKAILDSLKKPYYIIPGNHDTKWSESGCTAFKSIWGDDKFTFEYGGIRFIACSCGPNMKMGDGHVPPEDVRWVDSILVSVKDPYHPIIFINHYPLDESLDNWYELTDLLRKQNTIAVICGHGHSNKAYNFEGIPGTMGRSNLRGRNSSSGYNLVDVGRDSIVFRERIAGVETKMPWRTISRNRNKALPDTMNISRPDYSINRRYGSVSSAWTIKTGCTIGSTPAIWKETGIVGTGSGEVISFRLRDGTIAWRFSARASVYSSPDVADDRAVFGSSDGSIYCLNALDGSLIWSVPTNASVVASPVIDHGVVYIGGSDGSFRAMELTTGRSKWTLNGIGGFVETKPLVADGKVLFGAWDTYFYAINCADGSLAWKWSNGKPSRLLSPAACSPVASFGKVFLVAPDRFMTALDLKTGKEIWRTSLHHVRETIGVSQDGSRIYARLMEDSLLAFSATASMPELIWSTNCNFGYDIAPSMPMEKNGVVMFGTKNGLLYCLDAPTGSIHWVFKFGNTVLNTVHPLSDSSVLVATLDGEISLIESKK